MPCIFCDKRYNKRPCIRDGKYDSNPILKEPLYSFLTPAVVKKLLSVSVLLHGSCPCELCLVKTMCINLCEEYKYRASKDIEGVT